MSDAKVYRQICEQMGSICFAYHCLVAGAPPPASSEGIPSALLVHPSTQGQFVEIPIEEMVPEAQEIFNKQHLRDQLCVICRHGHNRRIDNAGNQIIFCKSCCCILSNNFKCKGRSGHKCERPLFVHQNGRPSDWCQKCTKILRPLKCSNIPSQNAERLVEQAFSKLNLYSGKYTNVPKTKRGKLKNGKHPPKSTTGSQKTAPAAPAESHARTGTAMR